MRDFLLALGGALLVIGAIELSPRPAIAGCLLIAAAYAIHRRLAAFWWIGCACLVLSLIHSLRDLFRGPQNAFGLMCSLLAVLTTALIASWWWRQKPQFIKGPTPPMPR